MHKDQHEKKTQNKTGDLKKFNHINILRLIFKNYTKIKLV